MRGRKCPKITAITSQANIAIVLSTTGSFQGSLLGRRAAVRVEDHSRDDADAEEEDGREDGVAVGALEPFEAGQAEDAGGG